MREIQRVGERERGSERGLGEGEMDRERERQGETGTVD